MSKCYECIHRGTVPGSCHSSCNHPEAKTESGLLYVLSGQSGSLNIKGNTHGIKSGWFIWPLDFDPVWLENCDGFKMKEGDKCAVKDEV